MIKDNMGEPASRPPLSVPPLPDIQPEEVAKPLIEDQASQLKESFAQTLRLLLNKHEYPSSGNGAAAELAERLNHRVTPSAILKWLSAERMPDAHTLVELSELFTVPIDYLLRGKTLPPVMYMQDVGADSAAERAEKLSLLDQMIVLPKIVLLDPKQGEKKFTGFSRSYLAEKFPGVLMRDIDLMTTQGDYMEPNIRHGDDIIFWCAPRFFQDNSVYILQVGHNRILRRIRQLVSGEYEVACDNARYPSEKVPADSFTYPLNLPGSGPLRIIGKLLAVIAAGR